MNKRIYISLACTLALSANAADLGTISVESSTIDDKFETKKTEVSNTAIISGKKIEDYHAENIANVLNNIPGVTVRINEGDSNKIHIRGIGSEVYMGEKPGVAIVIDGVPVQERAGSVNIDSDNIESIKVIKGGASYLYGNDALAGAVIITTKRPKANNSGFISTEVGSFNYKKFIAKGNIATDNMAIELKATDKSSDGYWDSSDYWAKSYNGKIQYYLDDTSDLTLGIDKSTRYENDTGSLTAVDKNGIDQISTNPTSIGEVGYAAKYDIELDKYFLTYSKDFENDSNLMAQIYKYEDTTKNNSVGVDTDNDGISDDHGQTSFANTSQKGLKSEYRKDGDTIASMIGVDVARNEELKNNKYRIVYNTARFGPPSFSTIGDITSDTKSNEDINALYGEVKYGINEKLTTTANIRLDKMKYEYTNNLTSKSWDKDFSETSYRLGGVYTLKEDSIIYLNTSTGFRVPDLSQIYAFDMGSRGITKNNLDIKTEKTYNYEIGYRGKVNNLSYDIAVFQLDRKDYINKNFGNYSDTPVGQDSYYDNIADIKNRGIELSVNSDFKENFSYDFAYTYLNSKYHNYDNYYYGLDASGAIGPIDNSGNYVPRTSKHTAFLAANYKILPTLLVTAEINYRSSQYADDMNLIKVDGYSVVNLRAKYDVKIAGYETQFFAQIDNLTDKQYYMMPRVTGDRNDDNVYDAGDMGLTVNPGRTYLAGLSVKF